MKLFQKLINQLNKSKLMQTKLALNGKEINLTSDDINIKSSNFSVNREGTMSCEKAIIKETI